MKCAGIIAKHTDPRAEKIVTDLSAWIKARGREVVLDRETAAIARCGEGTVRSKIPDRCDFLIVIGGDGTLLSAARVVGTTGKPILGVNLGSLGFLTAITLDELYPVLDRIFSYDFEYDERMMLVAHVHRLGPRRGLGPQGGVAQPRGRRMEPGVGLLLLGGGEARRAPGLLRC